MKKAFILILYLATFIICASANAFAVDIAPRISDREIIEGMANIRGDIKELRAEIKRLDEGQNALNKRFDDVNKRFDILQWMLGLFITVALSIMVIMGRILWNQQKKMTQMESSLETQKDEFSFLKTLIEKLLPPKGVL